jgi:hypothetical protein
MAISRMIEEGPFFHWQLDIWVAIIPATYRETTLLTGEYELLCHVYFSPGLKPLEVTKAIDIRICATLQLSLLKVKPKDQYGRLPMMTMITQECVRSGHFGGDSWDGTTCFFAC